jgi:hypothetical protein
MFDAPLRKRIGAAAATRALEICRENPANEIARVAEDLAHRRQQEVSAKAPIAGSPAAGSAR